MLVTCNALGELTFLADIVVYWLVSAIICGIVTGIVGSSKGRDGFGWFVIGGLLGIFGIILIALLPSLIPAQVKISGTWSEPPKATDTDAVHRPSIARQSGSAGGSTAPNPQKGYDARKWAVLKEVDAEISGVAYRIAALDSRLEDELAEKYLTLNDKAYLTALERQLTEKFAAEREKTQALMDRIGKDHAESSFKQMAHYTNGCLL